MELKYKESDRGNQVKKNRTGSDVELLCRIRSDQQINIEMNRPRSKSSERGKLKTKIRPKRTEQHHQEGLHTLEVVQSQVINEVPFLPNKKQKTQDKQMEVISSIQSSQHKVKKDLSELIEEYKMSAQKMMLNHGWDPQKEAQIRVHLKKLQHEKQQRRARFQQDLTRLQQKKKRLDKSTVSNQPDRQEKRASIQKRIAKINQREKNRQQQENKFIKFYQQFKSHKPKHKILQQRFNQKQKAEKEQKVRRHKQRLDEVYKPMDLDELQDFDEKYMERKYEAEKQRLQQHLMEKKQAEANRERLSQLYRGHCHSKVLEQLAEQNEKVNEGKQKYRRVREYSQLVRQEYQPRAKSGEDAQQDEEEIEGMMPKTQRGKRVVKDKFLKGEYMGKMVTFQKQALSHGQQNCKGLQYLQYLKSLPKRCKKQEKLPPMPPLKPKSGVYKVPRAQNPLYRASRRYNSIDLSVRQGDSSSATRVIDFMRYRQQQLKLDQKKLKNANYRNRQQWQFQQKSFNSQLVTNIEQKLQILKRL